MSAQYRKACENMPKNQKINESRHSHQNGHRNDFLQNPYADNPLASKTRHRAS